jgi:hypothetical protein
MSVVPRASWKVVHLVVRWGEMKVVMRVELMDLTTVDH